MWRNLQTLAYESSLFTVAVKAGGMRIVQKHQPTPVPEPPQKDEDEEEYVASRYFFPLAFQKNQKKIKKNHQSGYNVNTVGQFLCKFSIVFLFFSAE